MSDAEQPADPPPADTEPAADEAPGNTVIACNSKVQKLMDMLNPLSDKVGDKYSSQ